MPITQSRMLALITAAADYQQSLTAAQDLVRISRQRVDSGQLTPSEALEYLSQFIDPALLLRSPVSSNLAILSEQRHFKANARKNEAAARRQARRRGKAGNLPPTDTISHAFFNPPNIPQPPPIPTTSDSPSPPDLESDTLPDKEELF